MDLTLSWFENCFIIDASVINQIPTFTETDTKLYVPVVTLSTQEKENLPEELKSSFQRTVD